MSPHHLEQAYKIGNSIFLSIVVILLICTMSCYAVKKFTDEMGYAQLCNEDIRGC